MFATIAVERFLAMNNERLVCLIERFLDGQLAEQEVAKLIEQLKHSGEARSIYWETIQEEVLLQEAVRESAGRDMARLADRDLSAESSSAVLPTTVPSTGPIGLRTWLLGATALLSAVIGITLTGDAFRPKQIVPIAAPARLALASLQSLTGEVWVVVAEHKEKVSSGQQFFVDDELHVGEEGHVEVLLADGSRLVLGAGSILRFPSAGDGKERHVHLERGSADVEASHQSPNDPLIFSTTQAKLIVLGTRFRLYAGEGDSRVELEEGKVRFERKLDGQAVEVAAGHFATAAVADKPFRALSAQPLIDDWRLQRTLLRAGRQAVFSSDASRLATADHARIKVWDVATGEHLHTLKSAAWSDGLSFTQGNGSIVALSERGQALYWNLEDQSVTRAELKCDQGDLRRCAVSSGGRWLAQTSSVDSGYLPIWKVEASGSISRSQMIPFKSSGVALIDAETGPVVVASQWNGTTAIWDGLSGKERFRNRFRSEFYRMALSTEGRLLAGFGIADGLMLIDTRTNRSRNLWPPGSARVNALRFTSDGSSLFAAMDDGIVRAWSSEDGSPQLVLSTSDSNLTTLDVSADGRWLSTAGDHSDVKIWRREDD